MGPLISSVFLSLLPAMQCLVGCCFTIHVRRGRGRKHWSFRLRCRPCFGLPCTSCPSPSPILLPVTVVAFPSVCTHARMLNFDWLYSGNACKKASIVPELAERNEKRGMYKGIKRFTLWTEETHETHGFYRGLMPFRRIDVSFEVLSSFCVFLMCRIQSV